MAFEPLTPARRRELVRTTLLDAAEVEFLEHGYHEASLARIAAAAGFTKGAIYSNFESKEDLLLAVRARWDESIVATASAAADGASTPAGRLSAIAEVWAASIAEDPHRAALGLELRALALRSPQVREAAATWQRRSVEVLAAAAEAELAATGRRAVLPVERLAAVLGALGYGLSLHGQLTEGDDAGDLLREAFPHVLGALTEPDRPEGSAS